ncbi:MAG: alpha/beta hydrolase [Coriobacteriaceae bacterium]|nr:alpha/beta hydrolase [Coriobacteriaceae bacterium]
MTKLASYHLPGLAVEDHSIDVPLDWRGLEPAALAANPALRSPEPAIAGAPDTIKLFYRVVTAPEHAGRELPLLVFLQGGPGGAGPRLTSPDSDGWVREAVKHFRVVLPDQRGTGRSSRVSRHLTERVPGARAQADYLKRHLARSIVKDFEYLRLTAFGGRRWTTLGQSYGGFLTLTYLSFYPEGVAASFVCGGIPHLPASAEEVYAHTVPRMAMKTHRFYERYPGDRTRAAALADRLSAGDVRLPDGSPLSVRRLQLMGSDFGMKPSFERMHNILDTAFEEGDGALAEGGAAAVTDAFIAAAYERTSTAANPLYWTLQELIYADGELSRPLRWAAARELAKHPEFSETARPLMFTGETCLPWLFEEDPLLAPLKPAVDLLMEDTSFDPIYDADALAANTVPLSAAVYFDDLYVDSGLQLDTLSRVGTSRAWVTNELEHDGLHGTVVFRHLFEEARDRGDLSALL